MAFVKESLSDADLVLMMTDVFEDPREFPDQEIFAQMRMSKRSARASLPPPVCAPEGLTDIN